MWRERKHGLLKPLPIPERLWRDVSVDFIEKLPLSKDCSNIMVITDRLSRGVIIEAMHKIDAEAVAQVFVRSFYRRHGLPLSIISDRGRSFVSLVCSTVCRLLNITRRLSSAYHPDSDGGTERTNAEIEAYLRNFVDGAMSNWTDLLPVAELCLNNRTNRSIGMSSFFLVHGYDCEIFPDVEDSNLQSNSRRQSPVAIGEHIVQKVKNAVELAQTIGAYSQAEQEKYANTRRQPAPTPTSLATKSGFSSAIGRQIRPPRSWKLVTGSSLSPVALAHTHTS